MSEALSLLPHLERLLWRIDSLESPLVHVWGWPGSGREALLEALLEREGRFAVGLPLAAFETDDALRESLEEAHGRGARWLVAGGDPGDRLARAERWLRPGQRLVFASGARWRGERLSLGVVPPQEMLLSPQEVASLWNLLTGYDPDAKTVRALCAASDGWYRPLRLAIEGTGGLGLDGVTAEKLLDVPPVRFFLRHEVFDAFSEDQRDLLLSTPEERPGRGGDLEDGWRLVESRGLWVEGAQRDRLPRLLAAALDRERRRRGGKRKAAAPLAEAPEEKTVFALGLLGSTVAKQRTSEGERDIDYKLRRSLQVLAYLASSPGLEANREELIEAVWPTEGERTIERNFHPTLSHLRRALEGGRKGEGPSPLLFRGGIYRLNPEIFWEIDVIELSRLIDRGKELLDKEDLQGAVEAWQAAWRLYRGPFLQGHYETWVTERREEYQRQYLELLRDLGDLYVRLERLEEAMDAYRSVLLEDPLQERVHLAIMKIYASQGRRDLVRRQYDRLSQLLLEELGVAPMPHTTRDYHRLMA
ncbi:MAG TPA: BTAD domain-containing putative transcriptional regulator [Thermoanaerobaculia bacterium]|nr:BTAD domain-containing putative transcriptional regulator [Thermoanaerobaculia bacterium]